LRNHPEECQRNARGKAKTILINGVKRPGFEPEKIPEKSEINKKRLLIKGIDELPKSFRSYRNDMDSSKSQKKSKTCRTGLVS